MQVLESRTDRPLRKCPSCGKLGYLYTRFRNGHNYLYTIHKNEDPIGTYSNGEYKYRWCYDNGRLYESIEEAEKAEKQKKRKERKQKHLSIKIDCPKCREKGKLYKYIDREKGYERYRVMHKNRRCYLQAEHMKKIGVNDYANRTQDKQS